MRHVCLGCLMHFIFSPPHPYDKIEWPVRMYAKESDESNGIHQSESWKELKGKMKKGKT